MESNDNSAQIYNKCNNMHYKSTYEMCQFPSQSFEIEQHPTLATI